jgi:glutamate-1-semialdehyde 2,1-aminomutase
MQCNLADFNAFFSGMLHAGVYLAPSAYEAGFVSLAHGDDEIHMTLQAAAQVFETMSRHQ